MIASIRVYSKAWVFNINRMGVWNLTFKKASIAISPVGMSVDELIQGCNILNCPAFFELCIKQAVVDIFKDWFDFDDVMLENVYNHEIDKNNNAIKYTDVAISLTGFRKAYGYEGDVLHSGISYVSSVKSLDYDPFWSKKISTSEFTCPKEINFIDNINSSATTINCTLPAEVNVLITADRFQIYFGMAFSTPTERAELIEQIEPEGVLKGLPKPIVIEGAVYRPMFNLSFWDSDRELLKQFCFTEYIDTVIRPIVTETFSLLDDYLVVPDGTFLQVGTPYLYTSFGHFSFTNSIFAAFYHKPDENDKVFINCLNCNFTNKGKFIYLLAGVLKENAPALLALRQNPHLSEEKTVYYNSLQPIDIFS